jgi:16S rRNA (cytidine1402-2'-O)-methyltransferase
MAGRDTQTGTLFVVATPIGNLGDLSPRAAEVLRAVGAVAAEDTRRTLKLYAHLGAPAPTLLSLPAGNRSAETLRDLARALGDRPALLARELTKLHEELLRAPLSRLAQELEARGEVKGEVTIVVGPPAAGTSAAPPDEAAEPLEEELRRRLAAGEAPSALAREVARARGLKRSDVYDAIRKIRG